MEHCLQHSRHFRHLTEYVATPFVVRSESKTRNSVIVCCFEVRSESKTGNSVVVCCFEVRSESNTSRKEG
jgi:hypothetical protein